MGCKELSMFYYLLNINASSIPNSINNTEGIQTIYRSWVAIGCIILLIYQAISNIGMCA